MKQKFPIKVADIEFNILSEGSKEEVDAIVKEVDERIRAVCSKSVSISKIEAAILCALDYCSQCRNIEDSMDKNDDKVDELAEENKKAAATIAKLEAKLEAQKEKSESAAAALKERYDANVQAQKEKYEGRIENMKEKYEARIAQLKAKIEEMKSAENPEQMALDIPAAEEEAPAAAPAPAVEEAAPVAETEAKGKSKNKVGSMFELLTFGDV